MDARKEDVRAPTEDLRGSVSVVHVPVEDQHLRDAELPDRELGGDRDVVEQAEPHRQVALGVMPRGADGTKRRARGPLDQRSHHLARCARRMERGAVGRLAYERVCIDPSTAAGAELGNGPHVPRGVHQLEL
jgi:hypothetical protein